MICIGKVFNDYHECIMNIYILCVIVNPGKVLYIVLIYPCKVSWIGTIHCTAVVLCVGVSILFKVLSVVTTNS